MKQLRLSLLGFGTVGQWLAEALHTQQAWLQQEFGLVVTMISVATAHHGFVYRGDGLDIPTLSVRALKSFAPGQNPAKGLKYRHEVFLRKVKTFFGRTVSQKDEKGCLTASAQPAARPMK
ncbi:MAG TPA: hypothetical protein VFN02_05215 [Ktedonobacteraceae bacterium]|nr:hypothetical protein [Ktedonobacteraceae bacterium]